jgi:large subunit ribosomal protein L18
MASRILLKRKQHRRRRAGIRKTLTGTPQRPRLAVYRSLKHIYAQVIDDQSGKTLAAASSPQAKLAKGGNKAAAAEVGKLVAQKAKEAGVTAVAFDRGGFKYHGRLKALADAARAAGLKF